MTEEELRSRAPSHFVARLAGVILFGCSVFVARASANDVSTSAPAASSSESRADGLSGEGTKGKAPSVSRPEVNQAKAGGRRPEISGRKGASGAAHQRKSASKEPRLSRGASGKVAKQDVQSKMAGYQAAMEDYRRVHKQSGGPKSSKSEEGAEARRQGLADMKRARRDLRRAHQHDARWLNSMEKTKRKAMEDELKSRQAALVKTRKARKDKRRAELNRDYGDELTDEAAVKELAAHAWRVARLRRLIAIADVAERTETLARAKSLLKLEKRGHRERMRALTKQKEHPNNAVAVPGETRSKTQKPKKAAQL